MFSRRLKEEKNSSTERFEDSVLLDLPFWGHLNINLYVSFLLEKALQQTLSDLHQKNEQIVQLEGIVADQQNALKKEQERRRDLEESRSHLQQQVAILEEEMNRERNTSQMECSELQQNAKQKMLKKKVQKRVVRNRGKGTVEARGKWRKAREKLHHNAESRVYYEAVHGGVV